MRKTVYVADDKRMLRYMATVFPVFCAFMGLGEVLCGSLSRQMEE